MSVAKQKRRAKVKRRIHKKLRGDADRPRLAVFRSNKEIYAQLVDDDRAHTLAAASSRDKDVESKGTKKEVAGKVGQAIAQKAKEAGIEKIAFDRSGYRYHGRVKSLADGAREGGLKF